VAPPTSFRDFATHFVNVELPTAMKTVASKVGFDRGPISLRSMMDTVTLGKPVPAPTLGLGGNSNYILYSDCSPLIGVTVTINVTQDMACSEGFSFQLNAVSPSTITAQQFAAQQYSIAFDGNNLSWGVDNFLATDPPNYPSFMANGTLALLSNSEIPAGYQLIISLQNEANNITGATYTVNDNQGNLLKTYPLNLEEYRALPTQLAPIISLQLNLVGPGNSANVTLSSGSGLIVYKASTALTVANSWPVCNGTIHSGGTDENANSSYGMLSPGPSSMFSQPFGIITT
jgi:hypothetical protein